MRKLSCLSLLLIILLTTDIHAGVRILARKHVPQLTEKIRTSFTNVADKLGKGTMVFSLSLAVLCAGITSSCYRENDFDHEQEYTTMMTEAGFVVYIDKYGRYVEATVVAVDEENHLFIVYPLQPNGSVDAGEIREVHLAWDEVEAVYDNSELLLQRDNYLSKGYAIGRRHGGVGNIRGDENYYTDDYVMFRSADGTVKKGFITYINREDGLIGVFPGIGREYKEYIKENAIIDLTAARDVDSLHHKYTWSDISWSDIVTFHDQDGTEVDADIIDVDKRAGFIWARIISGGQHVIIDRRDITALVTIDRTVLDHGQSDVVDRVGAGNQQADNQQADNQQADNTEYAVNDYVEFRDESGRVEKGIIVSTDFNSVLVRYLGSTRKEWIGKGAIISKVVENEHQQADNIEYAVNDYVEFRDESGRVEKGIIVSTDFNSVLVRYLGSTRKEWIGKGAIISKVVENEHQQADNIEYAVNDYVKFRDESGRVEEGIIVSTDFNSVLVRYLGSTRKEWIGKGAIIEKL